jgi:predicted small secreted protein
MKTMILILAVSFVLGFASGCSTVHGFGQDLQDWTTVNTQR